MRTSLSQIMRAVRWSDASGTALVRPDGSDVGVQQTLPGGMRAVVIGDSLAALSWVVTASQTDYPIRSEFAHASVELGWPWELVYNGGVSGELASDIAARVPSILEDYDPDWVFIIGGAFINSVGSDVAYAGIIASLGEIFDACAGRRVVWCTSHTNSYTLTTAARKNTWGEVNHWAMQECRTRGFVGVDTSSAITDSSTGLDASGTLIDTLHPAPIGASAMARAIIRAVQRVYGLQPTALLTTNAFDPNNLVYNPYGSGSNASGTGGCWGDTLTGTFPNGWEAANHGAAGVGSKVSTADEIPIDWARIALTGGAGATSGAGWVYRTRTTTTWVATTAYQAGNRRVPTVANGFIYRAVVAGTSGGSQPSWPTTVGATVTDGTVTWRCFNLPTAGDTIRAAVEFRMSSWTGGASATAYIECLDAGAVTLTQTTCLMNRNSDPHPTYVMPGGVLLLPELIIPASTVNVNLHVRAYCTTPTTGNFDVRRVRCWLTNR